jgi:hypothetical protein
MRATYPKVGYYLAWISVPRLRLPNSGARLMRRSALPAASEELANGTIVSFLGEA